MNKLKLVSIITAAVIPLGLCSCSLRDFSGTLTAKTNCVELEEFNDHIRTLLDDVKISGNETAVQDDIDWLMKQYDIASDAASYAQLASNCDWYNTKLDEKYQMLDEQVYIMYVAMCYAFSKGCTSQYSELFEELADPDDADYFNTRGMNLDRVEGYASVDYRVSDEYLDSYYDVYFDDDLSDEEKDMKAAGIYLEMISEYDPEDFYTRYNRDYSPDDILELSDTVREYIIPAVDLVYEKFNDDRFSDAVFVHPVKIKDPFKVISKYADRLSPEISESADHIISEKLYTIKSGDKCYTGSYTDKLYNSSDALVYIYSDGSYRDMSAAVHEFGHFHADIHDHTGGFESSSNLDVAEIQSIAMELLFLRFYDEIYGEQSTAMKLLCIYDILDAVTTGFLIGEFEYTALTKAEDLTSEELLDLYGEIMGDYAEGYPFYYVSHLFESPGYYISYGVSALAALDILDECLNDPEQAVDVYEKIAAVPSRSNESSFGAALEESGFSDVLSKEYIIELSEKAEEIAGEITKSH